jgi:hypothetical protein
MVCIHSYASELADGSTTEATKYLNRVFLLCWAASVYGQDPAELAGLWPDVLLAELKYSGHRGHSR